MGTEPSVRAARGLCRALSVRVFVLYALRVAAIWAFAAGALALVWRLAWGRLPGVIGTAAALWLLAAAVLAAALQAWRRRPAASALLALLDCANRGGGLACAAVDGVDLNGWGVPPLPVPPPIRWRWQPAARLCGAALAFLAGTVLIPVPATPLGARQRWHADQAANALREQLAVLAEENLVPPEELRAWQEQLRQITESAAGLEPVRTWEALDYLDDAVAGKTAAALQAAQEWTAAMQQAEEVLNTLRLLAERRAMSHTEQARALGLLADQLRQAAAAAGVDLPPDVQEALREMLAGGVAATLTPEQMQRLASLLRQQREDRRLSPEQLARLRALSAAEVRQLLDRLAAGGECEGGAAPAELAAALCALPGGCDSAEALLAACASAAPGDGGVGRGRGDAALTWSGNTQPATAPMTAQALPSASHLDLDHAHLQGVSFGAATESTATAVGRGTLAASGGASRVRTQTILPRHRHAVEAYFRRGHAGP